MAEGTKGKARDEGDSSDLLVEETETRRLSAAGRDKAPISEKDRACLIVMTGAATGQVVGLPVGELIIGRGSKCSLHLDDRGVSRQHARVRVTDDEVTVEDLGSANGTWVNDEQIKEPVRLTDGDRVRLGQAMILKFTVTDVIEERFQRQLYESALRDGLTGLFNKSHLVEHLEAEFAYAKRHKTAVGVVMLDLDHFKNINDEHGHLVGDYVLQGVVRRIAGILRTEDFFARYGGEEFCIVSRGISLTNTVQLARRVVETVGDAPINVETCPALNVTVSAGVASFPEHTATGPVDLLALADQALLEAKRGGRNRVVVA